MVGEISFDFSFISADELSLLLAGLGQQTTESFAQQQPLVRDVVNSVTVVVADTGAITAPSTTQLDAVTATAADSIVEFGETAAQVVVILDNSINPATGFPFAQDLAEYLIRQLPQYWFSNIEISMNGLTDEQRDLVAVLEIGDQIRVSKRFPNVANPVVEDLFVEGIDHKITPSNHTIVLQCSPADLFGLFILDTSELDDADVGLG
jgi:hypothetical protein